MLCESVDFNFLRKAPKCSFVDNLEKLGCIDLFNVSDEVYPQLVLLFYANFEKVEPQGEG